MRGHRMLRVAATWIGDAWVVALGGEGDGVLVRVSAPKSGL